MNLKITVDGSCRFGRCRAGVVIRNADTGVLVNEVSASISAKTSNEAEYMALLLATNLVLASGDSGIQWARELNAEAITFFTDSQLLVRQLNGAYRIQGKSLRKLHQTACQQLTQLKAKVKWHSREEGDGPRADELSKEEDTCKSKFSGRKTTLRGNSSKSWQRAVFALSKNQETTEVPNLSSDGLSSPV